jgi:hypothetical protein
VIAHTGTTVVGVAVRCAVKAEQRGDLRVGDQNDVATVSAVTAVWPCQRLEFLAANGDASITAVAGTKVQRHLVNKSCHDDCSLPVC